MPLSRTLGTFSSHHCGNSPPPPLPPQAFKASPADGWIKIKGGDTVSVYRNESGKLPYNTTLVRCEFPVMAAAEEAQRHFLDLTERGQRDFFFKEGKLLSFNGKDKKVIQAQMRTLAGSETAVQILQTIHTDEKGNHTIVEVPGESSKRAAGNFFFPCFWIQNISPTSCNVIAIYRFDFGRACPKQSDFSDGEAGSFLQERFNKYVEPLAHSLFLLGDGAMPAAPTRRSVEQKPVESSPLQRRTPERSPEGGPQDRRGGGGGRGPSPELSVQDKGRGSNDGSGELIVGGKFKWKKGELIGHGSIGKVYMGLDFETGEMMAVKQVDLGQQLGPQAAEELKAMDQEILIFSKISHPNIVRYYGMEKDEGQLSIFLELVSGGSIASMLRKFGTFSEQMISNFTAQIVDGLDYLHQQQICHRDIKAANILYSNEGIVKLADFGTAKKIADVMNMSTGLKSLVGTPYMMAPEVIRQTGHGMPADIWSLACVIWEMATCKPPFNQFTDRIVAMYNIAHATKPPEPPDVLSDAARDFVTKCMLIDAKARATTRTLLQHHFVASVVRKTPAVGTPIAGPPSNMRFPSEVASMDSIARSEFVSSKMPIDEEDEEEGGGVDPVPSRGKSRSSRSRSPGGIGLGAKYMDDDDDEEGAVGGGDAGSRAGRNKGQDDHGHGHRRQSGKRMPLPLSPGNKNIVQYELTDSEESGEDDVVQLRAGVPDKGNAAIRKYQGELSEDGLTRAQADAMGKKFVPAMGGGGSGRRGGGGGRLKGYGSREERTDSEDSSGEEMGHHHRHNHARGGAGGSKLAGNADFSDSESD
jgi:serine/threonine protein kinase